MSNPNQSPTNKVLPPVAVFTTSGLGGILGWIVVHPANTLAVRWNLSSMTQSSTTTTTTMKKPFSVRTMIQQQGFMSLYDGLSAGIARQVFYATSRFGLFETFRDQLHVIRGKTDFTSRVFLGAVSGGIAAYISCPMEVCVVRMANDSSLPLQERRNYKGIRDTATRIITEEGIGAFWRGSTPFVQRAMMVGVFQVATLDQFKDYFASTWNQKLNSVMNVFCAAMSSGLLYSMATMPLEAAKNRMASQKVDPITGTLPYTSTIQTLQSVSKKEGFLALYNGFLPYYARCGGHTVAMFISVQLLRDLYLDYML